MSTKKNKKSKQTSDNIDSDINDSDINDSDSQQSISDLSQFKDAYDDDGVIIQGSFHQGDSRFGAQAGNQCIAISCVAICYSSVKSILTWQSADLDQIVILGDILYTISKSEQSTNENHLEFLEVQQYVNIEDSIYHFNTDYKETDSENELIRVVYGNICSEEELGNRLIKFFHTNKNIFGIFTCNDYSFAIGHINSKYIVFSFKKLL